MNMTNQNLIILAVIAAIFLYIVYSNQQKEGFGEDNNSNPETTKSICEQASMPIRFIRSKYVGVVVDVMSADGATVGDINSDYLVLVKKGHTTQSLQANADGTVSLAIPNGSDKNQLWQIKKIESGADLQKLDSTVEIKHNKYPYNVVVAKNSLSSGTPQSLHYENGNLAVRPLGDYTAQHWEVSFKAMTSNSVPLISSSEHSIFSAELDKANSARGGTRFSNQTLSQMNSQFSADATKAIKEMISTFKNENKIETPSESPFGKEPLKLVFNLGHGVKDILPKEEFVDSNAKDVNTLLSRYEADENSIKESNELSELINGTKVCKSPNMDEWISRAAVRGSCHGCAV